MIVSAGAGNIVPIIAVPHPWEPGIKQEKLPSLVTALRHQYNYLQGVINSEQYFWGGLGGGGGGAASIIIAIYVALQHDGNNIENSKHRSQTCCVFAKEQHAEYG